MHSPVGDLGTYKKANSNTNWQLDDGQLFMCRQRLIEYGQNRTDLMDVGFVGYVQCSEEACTKMQVSHTPTTCTAGSPN